MAALVARVRETEQLLGSGIKALSPAEGETVEALRRSAVARDDIPAGTILALEHLDWLRPEGGLAPGQVRLEVFDLTGQKVRTLVDKIQGPGFYQVHWDGVDERGAGVATGTYFGRFHTGEFVRVHKMTLLK